MHGSYDITDRKRHSTKTLYSLSCFSVVVFANPTFRRNVLPSCPGFSSVYQLPHNPDDKGGKLLRNVAKKLNTGQQHMRPGSSTGTQWKPQIVVFAVLKMYIISYYFNIVVYCVVLMHD
jgi:hypothetical protein